MDDPFLTPFERPPVPVPKPKAAVVPLTVAPTLKGTAPVKPPASAGPVVVAVALGLVVLAGLVWVCRPTDLPPTDSPVSVTTRTAAPPPAPTAPASVFEEQDELDRRVERLIEAVAGGQPDVKARLAQMRAVLGDARFLADLPDCAKRAGVTRLLTADERTKLAELTDRHERLQARIARGD